NYGKPDQDDLKEVHVDTMEHYLQDGQFGIGSMEPKVRACIDYVRASRNPAVITSLDNLHNYLKHGDGTTIIP
ncbi:MAG: carbamate kinase, partial [Lactobacillaceae bacterium]|nr:carbamate kinase [Lactobacillaceae bacterium]